MNRPTKEQVEAVCKAVDVCKDDDWLAICHGRTLAAEVRALQAEAEQLKEQLHHQQQTHARQLREMGRDWPRGGFNRDPFGGLGV